MILGIPTQLNSLFCVDQFPAPVSYSHKLQEQIFCIRKRIYEKEFIVPAMQHGSRAKPL